MSSSVTLAALLRALGDGAAPEERGAYRSSSVGWRVTDMAVSRVMTFAVRRR
jgi:hypothetical protein